VVSTQSTTRYKKDVFFFFFFLDGKTNANKRPLEVGSDGERVRDCTIGRVRERRVGNEDAE
jgi:hypothetical protein